MEGKREKWTLRRYRGRDKATMRKKRGTETYAFCLTEKETGQKLKGAKRTGAG